MRNDGDGYTDKVKRLLTNVRLDVFQSYIGVLVADGKCPAHMTLEDIRKALEDKSKKQFVMDHYKLTEAELDFIVAHSVTDFW